VLGATSALNTLFNSSPETFLHRDGRGDARVGLVVLQLEILEHVIEEGSGPPLDAEARGREGLARELEPRLLRVVEVEVAVAARPDEVARVEPALLGHHVCQQRVTGDVEGDAEEDVGRALVELAGEAAFGDVELEEEVTGRERHPLQLAHVPIKTPSLIYYFLHH
jgi:hypothetical protein